MKNNKVKRNIFLLIIALFAGAFFVVNSAVAQVTPPENLYVHNATGSDCNDCSTPLSPCKTIQAAVDKAEDGDNIWIGDGIYNESVSIEKEISLMPGEISTPSMATVEEEDGVRVDQIDIKNSTKNVYIKGLVIIKMTADPAGEGTVIEGNLIGYIHLGSQTEGVLIEENVFDAQMYEGSPVAVGALYENSKNNTKGDKVNIFRNNTVKNATEGIGVVGNPVIENNTFENNVYHIKSYTVDGFDKTDFENILVENTFDRAVVIRYAAPSVYPTTLESLELSNGFSEGEIKEKIIFSSIEEAIDEANSYDIVDVLSGTYQETLAIEEPLTLKGAGSSQTIIDGDGLKMKANSVILINSSDVNIEGLKIINGDWGVGVRNDGEGTIIREIDLSVVSRGIRNINFEDVVVEGSDASGFVFDGRGSLSDVTFTNCRADNNGNRGIYFAPNKFSTNVTLINTSANDNQVMGFNNQGIMENLVINGGTFNNNVGGSPKGTTEGPYYGFGISVEHTTGVDIQGVTASGNGTGGPAEGGAGIVIKGETSNVEISGVTLTGNQIGLWFEPRWEDNPVPKDTKIINSSIFGNIDYGIKNDIEDGGVELQGVENGTQGLVVDAKLNWWGSADGPEQVILNGVPKDVAIQETEETREKVSVNVLFDPWWVNEEMTRDSDYQEPGLFSGGGSVGFNNSQTTGGEVLGETDTQGEVLGETDSRDYEEQEQEKREKMDELNERKEKVEEMKDIVNALLEETDDEEKKNLLLELLEELEELEEAIDEELEATEEELEEIVAKVALSKQKERAENSEETINMLLSLDDLTEEERASLEELLERAQEIKGEIEERLNQ